MRTAVRPYNHSIPVNNAAILKPTQVDRRDSTQLSPTQLDMPYLTTQLNSTDMCAPEQVLSSRGADETNYRSTISLAQVDRRDSTELN